MLRQLGRHDVPVEHQGPGQGQAKLGHIMVSQVPHLGLLAGVGKQAEHGLLQGSLHLLRVVREGVRGHDGDEDVHQVVQAAFWPR